MDKMGRTFQTLKIINIMKYKMMWLLSPGLRNNILGSLENLADKEL